MKKNKKNINKKHINEKIMLLEVRKLRDDNQKYIVISKESKKYKKLLQCNENILVSRISVLFCIPVTLLAKTKLKDANVANCCDCFRLSSHLMSLYVQFLIVG